MVGPKAEPASFLAEILAAQDFDLQGALGRCRSRAPLDVVEKEAEQYLASVREDLGRAINEDYGAFVEMAGSLGEIDAAVARLRSGLTPLSRRLQSLRTDAKLELEALETLLARRADARRNTRALRQAQGAAVSAAKVDRLLSRIDEAADQPVPERARALERAAGEVARLTFLLRTCDATLPGIAGAARAAAGHTQRVVGHLESCLAAALRGVAGVAGAPTEPALPHLMHAFRALGADARAEAVVRAAWVAPQLRAALPAGDGAGPFQQWLHAATDLSRRTCSLLGTTSGASSDERELRPGDDRAPAQGPDSAHAPGGMGALLGACVLPEVEAVAVERFAPCMSPGKPEEFLRGYLACVSFLASLEASCSTQADVRALRDHASTKALLGRWNVRAFAALRFQTLAAQLEGAMTTATLAGLARREPGVHGMRWALLAQCRDVLSRCLPEKEVEWGAPGLAERSLWVALQVPGRLRVFLTGAFDGMDDAPKLVPQSWAASGGAGDLLVAAAELRAFVAAVQGAWLPPAVAALRGAPGAGPVLERAVDEALVALDPLPPALLGVAAGRVAAEAAQAIAQIKGVAASFRMTQRPMPAEASPYVALVVRPLAELLQSDAAGALPRDDLGALRGRAAQLVCEEYAAQVSDLLASVRRTEGSLAKLKRGRVAPGTEGGPSNLDKIAAQMRIDVEAFAGMLETLGVDAASLPALETLRDAANAQEAQGAPGPE